MGKAWAVWHSGQKIRASQDDLEPPENISGVYQQSPGPAWPRVVLEHRLVYKSFQAKADAAGVRYEVEMNGRTLVNRRDKTLREGEHLKEGLTQPDNHFVIGILIEKRDNRYLEVKYRIEFLNDYPRCYPSLERRESHIHWIGQMKFDLADTIDRIYMHHGWSRFLKNAAEALRVARIQVEEFAKAAKAAQAARAALLANKTADGTKLVDLHEAPDAEETIANKKVLVKAAPVIKVQPKAEPAPFAAEAAQRAQSRNNVKIVDMLKEGLKAKKANDGRDGGKNKETPKQKAVEKPKTSVPKGNSRSNKRCKK